MDGLALFMYSLHVLYDASRIHFLLMLLEVEYRRGDGQDHEYAQFEKDFPALVGLEHKLLVRGKSMKELIGSHGHLLVDGGF